MLYNLKSGDKALEDNFEAKKAKNDPKSLKKFEGMKNSKT